MKKFKKKWRKLTIEEKTNILISQFNLAKSDIDNIRKLKDMKKRLIEAAKLQFESFGNIHTDLTAWIAGYKSDSVVRQKFGSSLALREKFIHFKNYYPDIKPTWNDIRNNIKLPKSITEDLAEEVGIHIGDGNLNNIKTKQGWNSYQYRIDGNLTDEFLYHNEFIKPLMRKLYNCNGYQVITRNRNSIQSNFRSKLIFCYKNKIFGLPIGSKINIEIPEPIFENDQFAKRCIVGILDTDFNLNRNISFNGQLNSLKVIKQMDNLLTKFSISHLCKIYGRIGKINIRKEDSIKILEEWKLHNHKHISKYLIWKEFKTFIPFTHTEERLAVLKGKLSVDDLKSISNKRKKSSSLDKNASRLKSQTL
jgi:hypothetical protein